jgi:hypothetical protein
MAPKHTKAAPDEIPTADVAAPAGAEAPPAEASADAKLAKARRVDGLTYDPRRPPKTGDATVVAQVRVTIGATTYPVGTRLTLSEAAAERLVAAGQATRATA